MGGVVRKVVGDKWRGRRGWWVGEGRGRGQGRGRWWHDKGKTSFSSSQTGREWREGGEKVRGEEGREGGVGKQQSSPGAILFTWRPEVNTQHLLRGR